MNSARQAAAGPAPIAPASRAATLWWLFDVAGAALFAGGLAVMLGLWGDGRALALGLAALLASGLVRALAQARAAEAGMAAAARAKADLRAARLPVLLGSAFARGRMAGEDAARAVDQIESIEGFSARYQPLAKASRLAPLIVAALVATVSPVAAAILLLTLLPFGFGMMIAGGAARAAADRQVEAIGRLNGLFADRLRALAEIRSFGAESRIGRQLAAASDEVSQRTMALFRVAFVSGGVLEFLAALSVALVALYCGFNLLGLLPFDVPERLGLTAAFFALAMAPEFYLPMRRLAAAYHDKQTGEAAQLALADALPPLPVRRETADFAGVRLVGGVVRYGETLAVGPVDLAVPATGLVAIVGPSGSGKSSLMAALAGLRPLSDGLLDWAAGAPAAAAWAGQRPLVMAGTLEANILLGGGSDAAGAAAAAGLAALLTGRGGLRAMLDASGSGLSGGERRRLGLARALASGRALLLLDEPTADLDAETAAGILATICAVARTRAVVVATHDPALAAAAQVRLVLA